MSLTVAYKIKFIAPYHIGWRSVEYLIDGSTILKALVSLAYSLGMNSFVKEALSCSVSTSAALPTLSCDGKEHLLIPFPPLPSTTNLSKLGTLWITLTSLKKLINAVNTCSTKGYPIVGKPEYDDKDKNYYLPLECRTHEGRYEMLKLKLHGPILHLEDESINCGEIKDFFKEVKYYRNRLDRISTAADLYQVSGYISTKPLSILITASEQTHNNLESMFKVLAELGIGGFRSRGWGKFKFLGKEVINTVKFGFNRAGYYALLSSTPYLNGSADLNKSFVTLRYIEGRGGPTYEEYTLPYCIAANVGSLIYLKSNIQKCSETLIIGKESVAHLLFNPLLLGGGE